MIVHFGPYKIQVKQENQVKYIYDIVRKKWIVDSPEDKVRQVQQFFNTITSEIRIAAFNNTRACKTVSIQAT